MTRVHSPYDPAAAAAYYQAHKAEQAERTRRWRAANPDKVAASRKVNYERNQRPVGAVRKPRGTPEERFWRHVDRSGGPDACWPWTGNTYTGGYGLFRAGGRGSSQVGAHRFALELKLGRPLLPEMQARHIKCDNPPCCNGAHLAEGTGLDNMADMVAHGRQATGDRHGHVTRPERTARGERHGRATITDAGAREIRRRKGDGEVQRSIARSLGVSEDLVSRVVRGRTWAHVR